MRLLADTHIALWAILDDQRLSPLARRMLEDPTNTVFISVASLWEIATKRSQARTGPGAISLSSEQALSAFVEAGFEILPVETAHALAVERLPLLHSDPFDRMLVAQALVEGMRVLTHDATVAV